ncbi:hypothetical protein F5I97DRAFT_535793 [Phlebopus sp. FC_14]|nr:hypothetical protein F5I97DRAFT_535793 [Phlebopus sp. FC_14]
MFRASTARRVALETAQKLHAVAQRHICLTHLPRSALPSDIRRLIRREKLVGVEDGTYVLQFGLWLDCSAVQLDLYRFISNRRAYLTLTHPDFLKQNIAKLDRASIGGYLINANPCGPPPATIVKSRGVKGREAAARRGAMTGTGPSGCIPSNGRYVCVWGFPPKATAESVKELLAIHDINGLGDKPEIYKIPLPDKNFSLYSRHLIRTPSISYSYLIVRRLNMTFFQPDIFGAKFQLRATVVR